MDPSQVLKGLLDTAVLGALRGRPTYGYDLVRQLRSQGFDDVADASVYGTLRRLHRAGFLSAEIVESDEGPARKYYTLTVAGETELDASTKTWVDMVAAMDRTLAESR